MDGKGPRAGCGNARSEPAGGVVAGQVAAPFDAASLQKRQLAHAAELYDGGRNPGATGGRGEDDLRRGGTVLGFQDDVDAGVGGGAFRREGAPEPGSRTEGDRPKIIWIHTSYELYASGASAVLT